MVCWKRREDKDANRKLPAGAPRQATNTVVFSFFTKALELLRRPLEEAGITFAVLDGRTTLLQRAEVVFGLSWASTY